MAKILIVGGAGYIGSINVKLFLDKGFDVVVVESSIFDFSAASFNLCIAILSVERSTPSDFLNSATR